MNFIERVFRSSLGLKYVMAITGIALIGFVIAHLSGNLLTYVGQDAFNAYAAQLKSLGGLLWIARIGLLVLAILHIYSAIKLTRLNMAARPQKYAKDDTWKASLASRTMPISGLIVLFFILYHLAHFTFLWTHPEYHDMYDSVGRHDVYSMVVAGFGQPIVSAFYIIAVLLLGFHLSHGIRSLFQSLGLNSPLINSTVEKLGPALSWIIAIGFASIPISVLAGIIR